MRVWVRSASCAARRLEGRPALLRGAALVGGRRSVLARGEMSGAAAGGSGMSGAAVPCSRNEFCGDSSARRDIIRHLKSQSNVGVRYVAKLAERRSCRLRGRHTGIYDLSTFNWASSGEDRERHDLLACSGRAPSTCGIRPPSEVRAVCPRSGVEVEVDSFFLPRRRIASDLVRERRRFDNKKRAVGKVQQHAQQQHVHVRCNSLTLRGGAESAPRSEGLSL